MLDHALAWAARGFRIFPLHVMSKTPLWKGWTEDATADEEIIRSIWTGNDYNIGVLCNDLIVVDIDVKDGKDGFGSFLELGLSLDTLVVKTPSGGRHIYYTGPNVSLSAGKLGEGLDIRSFHGYVIAPGSILPNGAYEIETDRPVARTDPAFVARLDAPRDRASPTPLVELDEDGAVSASREWLERQTPLAVQGVSGDQTTFIVAATLKDRGISETTALALMVDCWNDRCSPPWGHEELKQKVSNAYTYGKRTPGVEHPAHVFEGVRVPIIDRPGRTWFRKGDDWRGSVTWLYRDLLPTTGVCLLTAQSQAGKTFVAIDMADSLSLQRPFFGVEPRHRGGTIMMVGEGYGSVKLRLAAIQGEAVSVTYVGGLAGQGALDELHADLKAEAAAMERAHGYPVRLLILDTLSAAGLIDKENDNALSATAIKALNEISADMNALFLVIHHPPKDGEGSRGAGAIKNNSDYVLEIKREGMEQVRDLELTKSRDGEQRVIGTFTLEPVVVGHDDEGEIKTMIVVPGEARISKARLPAGAAHAPLFVESLEWATISGGVDMYGKTVVDAEDVLEVFVDRWPGKKNKSNIARAFKATLRYATDMNAVNAFSDGGITYLQLKEIE